MPRRQHVRILLVCLLASTLLASPHATAQPESPSELCALAPAVACGEAWRATFDGPGLGRGDVARDAQTSPSGDRLYVTGNVYVGEPTDPPYTLSPAHSDQLENLALGTIAYDTRTGEELWTTLYSGPAGNRELARRLVVDPGGERVHVVGTSAEGAFNTSIVTVTYDAETGEELWAQRHEGRGQFNGAVAADIDPAGERVFVTGSSFSPFHLITVAYDAKTGEELWLVESTGDQAAGEDLVVDPSGERVYITSWVLSSVAGPGHPFPGTGIPSYQTIAYDTASGEELWTTLYHGHPGLSARPTYGGGGMDVAPSGERLFVTGSAWTSTSTDEREMHTVAYDTATGDELWVAVVEHPDGDHRQWRPNLVAAPDSGRAFVTFRLAQGAIEDHRQWTSGNAMRAVAYDAATGEELWLTDYAGTSTPRTPVTSPDGNSLYVIGDDYTVAAFDAQAGGLLWDYGVRPNPRTSEDPLGGAVAVHPDGNRLFATGSTAGDHLGDYLTVGLVLGRLPDPGTSRVDTMGVAVGDSIQVSGAASFQAPPVQVGSAEQGSGATAAPGAGMDLASATVTQRDHSLLVFDVGVHDMPPTSSGVPEVVHYDWDLAVQRDGGEAGAFTLQAVRSAQGAEPGSFEPVFRLMSCDEGGDGAQCSEAGPVTGEFHRGGLRFFVERSTIDATGGAVLTQARDGVAASYGASGLRWGLLGDRMAVSDFIAYGATVELGVAPAGTPDGDVVFTIDATVAPDGGFSGELAAPDAPGDYQVVARACLGPNSCGLASTVIAVN